MPSPDARSVDLPIQVLGGRVTQFDPQALPQGASPFNRDVIFSGANAGGELSVGSVGTRPGMQSLYAAFDGNPAINYIRTFVDSSGSPHQLLLDSLGLVRDDFPEATFTQIGTVVANAFAQSDTYAGREWLAIGDGKYGIDIPRQYNGVNFDRVSQVGPGQAPNVQDVATTQLNIAASPGGLNPQNRSANIGNTTEAGNIVTITTTANLDAGVLVGDEIVVTNTLPAGYNGTFKITAILAPNQFQYYNGTSGLAASTQASNITFNTTLVTLTAPAPAGWGPLNSILTIAGAGVAGFNGSWMVRSPANGGATLILYVIGADAPLANSGNGTIVDSGNISTGLHQVSVAFVFRDGTISCPAIPNSWTAGGSKKALVTNIAIGPFNVLQRILIFTPVIVSPATTGPFFYLPVPIPTFSAGTFPSMVISDNVTTSLVVDFLDAVLQAGTAATSLFNLLELGECSGTLTYSERTFWTGERNKVNAAGGGGGFNNLTFDGGFPYNGQQFQIPLGWTNDSTAGGRSGPTAQPPNCIWGDGLKITGDGATAIPARIYQGAFQDYLGVPIIKAGTAYSIRVRVATDIGNNFGTLHIRLNSPSQGIPAVGLSVALNALGVGGALAFTEVIQSLLPASAYPNSGSVPSDLRLEVYVDNSGGSGILGNTHFVSLDNIEPFPTNQAINRTLVRASYAFQPAAFDGVTGQLIVGKDNGQAAKCMFKLLDKKLYIVKERSFYGTQDDGANEPSLWVLDPISGTVGTLSIHGVDVAGEAWAVIAAHDGLYIFWGAEPVKISQEIQPDWDTINWNAGQNLWVVVDSQNKRIHVGVPTGTSIVPNQEFVMDYSQLNDAADIAASPQAHYAYFNPSNIVAPGRARKWTIWNLSNNCGALTLRADGSYHLLRGNAAGNGKVYDQVATQTSDDGVAINSMYQTYYFPNGMEEQELQQIIGGHRRLFKYLTGYAFGAGVMTWSAHGQQDNRIVALSNLVLSNPARWEFEKNCNLPSERASLIFGTNAVGAWWHLSKVKPTITKDTMLVRGVA